MSEKFPGNPAPSAPTDSKDEKQVYVLPPLPAGRGVFYDTEKHQVWIGVDLEKFPDAVFSWAAVESSKLEFLCYFMQFVQDAQRRAKLSGTGVLDRLNAGLKKVLH